MFCCAGIFMILLVKFMIHHFKIYQCIIDDQINRVTFWFFHMCLGVLSYHTYLLIVTHWCRVTHICISKLTSIGLNNGFTPYRRQAIIRTNVGISLIRASWTDFSEILSEINTFSVKKMHLKMSSAKWWQCCLGLNVLTHYTAASSVVRQYGTKSLPVVMR